MNYIKFPFIMLYRMFVLSVLRRKLDFTFLSSKKRWYVMFNEYPGPKANLEMVCGADKLCEAFSKPNPYSCCGRVAKFKIGLRGDFATRTLEKQPIEEGSIWNGRTYTLYNSRGKYKHEVWLCPVMLYTFGHYPKRIYIWKDYTN